MASSLPTMLGEAQSECKRTLLVPYPLRSWVRSQVSAKCTHSLGALPSREGQGLDHSIVLRLSAHDSNLCFVNCHICCGFLCIRSYLGLVTGLVITLLHKREFCSNWYVTLSALCPACTFNWKKLSLAGGGNLWTPEVLLEALELLSLCVNSLDILLCLGVVPAMTKHLEKWQPGSFQRKSPYFSFPCKLFYFFFVLWATTTYRSCSSSRSCTFSLCLYYANHLISTSIALHTNVSSIAIAAC